MIQIIDKKRCCGCSACKSICPTKCITMQEDHEGFLYPVINKVDCLDCGLCERVCPCLNQGRGNIPRKTYAIVNPDEEIRGKSSSGGLFSLLAEQIIQEGGIVFGARFDDNWEVMHDYTDTINGLMVFRGSKYVQSRISGAFCKVRSFLKSGRKVLFTGTPCQIAGLKNFLQREYDNLLTVDIVCHGVPSPLVWREYFHELMTHPQDLVKKNTNLSSLNGMNEVTGVAFRDKQTGWKNYGFSIWGKLANKGGKHSALSSKNTEREIFRECAADNLFMRLFLKDLCLRPSCYCCPAKKGKSNCDITLGDFWGIGLSYPSLDDNRGTSLALVYSDKGNEAILRLNSKLTQTNYQLALASNLSIEKSPRKSKYVNEFWNRFHENKFTNIEDLLDKIKPTIKEEMLIMWHRITYKIIRIIY